MRALVQVGQKNLQSCWQENPNEGLANRFTGIMKSDGNKYVIPALGMIVCLKPRQLIVGCFIIIMLLTHVFLREARDIPCSALEQLKGFSYLIGPLMPCQLRIKK